VAMAEPAEPRCSAGGLGVVLDVCEGLGGGELTAELAADDGAGDLGDLCAGSDH